MTEIKTGEIIMKVTSQQVVHSITRTSATLVKKLDVKPGGWGEAKEVPERWGFDCFPPVLSLCLRGWERGVPEEVEEAEAASLCRLLPGAAPPPVKGDTRPELLRRGEKP